MSDASSKSVIPTARSKPFFRRDPLTTILLTCGIFFGSQLAAVILISTIPSFMNMTETEAMDWLRNSTTAQFLLMLLVAIFASSSVFYLLRRVRLLPARIGAVAPRLRDVGYAFIGYGLYFVSYLAVVITASILIPNLDTSQAQSIGFEGATEGVGLMMAFFALVILPPIWEEIIFRGFLFSSLRAKLRLRWAVLITSLIFGVAHLELGNGGPLVWVAAIDTFVLSCYLCMLRERSGSLWPPILLHGIKNFVAFYFLFIR